MAIDYSKFTGPKKRSTIDYSKFTQPSREAKEEKKGIDYSKFTPTVEAPTQVEEQVQVTTPDKDSWFDSLRKFFGGKQDVSQETQQGLVETLTPEEVRVGIEKAGVAEKVARVEEFRSKEVSPVREAIGEEFGTPQAAATAPIRLTAGSLARFVVSVGLEKANSDLRFTPESKLQELIIGKEDIARLSDQSLTYGITKKSLEDAGFSSDFANNAGLTSALIVGAIVENPFLAGTGSSGKKVFQKSIERAIQKETGEKVTKELSERIARDVEKLMTIPEKNTRERVARDLMESYKKTETTPSIVTKPDIVEPIKPAVDIKKEIEAPKPETKLFKTEKEANEVTEKLAKDRQSFQKDYPSFEIPDETITQKLQRQIQDKMNRLTFVQKKIKEAGGKISDADNPYLSQELFIGRVSNKIENLQSKIIKGKKKGPKALLERMADDGVQYTELSDYMKARHAFERNKRIAEINPNIKKNGEFAGSGMTDKEAQAILDNFEKKGVTKKLDSYYQEFRKEVIEPALDLRVKEGLISKDEAKILRDTYSDYVPLKRVFGDEDQIGNIGSGFSLTGKDIRKAKGSLREVQDPFVQSLLDYESAIIRAEKNKVAKKFLEMVEANPNPKLWNVSDSPLKKAVNETGEYLPVDATTKLKDNILEVMVDGKRKLITINDPALAQAMKGMGVERGFKSLQKINNYLRGINTVFNPEFVITNFARDVQAAGINLSAEQSAKMTKDTMKDVFNGSAMNGIRKNIRGEMDNVWAKEYEELKELGGKVGWFNQDTVTDRLKKIDKSIKKYNQTGTKKNVGKVVDTIGETILDMNEAVESAVRLSAFKQAKLSGMSANEAASLAKNLTVNFNKKGNLGTALDSLYLFFNAGVQGGARALTALKTKRGRKIGASIVGFGYGIAEMNRAINQEDYDKIPDSIKERNLILMSPGGGYVKIPLPYGYNVLTNLGTIASETTHGRKDVGEASKDILLSFDAAFNPVSSADLTQALSPTIADPFIQMSTNKNWFGSPIKPEQKPYQPRKPESQLYFNSVRPQSRDIAQLMNSMTGGTSVESGLIDISPELIDHFTDFLTGGIGRVAANTISTGQSVIEGDAPELNNIPFVRKLVATPPDFFESKTVFDTMDKSGNKLLSEYERNLFITSLQSELEDGSIDEKKAKQYFKTVIDNQKRIKDARKVEELKKLSPTERESFLNSLNFDERNNLLEFIGSL